MDQSKDFIEDEELRTSLLSFLDVVTQTGNEKLAITIRTSLDKKVLTNTSLSTVRITILII